MTASRSPAPVTGIARAVVLTALMGIAQAVPPGWAENVLQITDFCITARMEEIADAAAGEEVGLNVFCTLDADQLAEQIPAGYTLKSRFSFWFPNGSAGTVIVPTGGSTGWTDEPIWWYYGACSFSGIGVQEVRVRAEVRVLNPQGAQVLELAAEETAAVNIYRPDILLEGGENEFMNETTEEARGSYFTPGKVKRCRLTFEGVPPDDPNFRVGLQVSRVVVYTDSACTIPLQECQWMLAGMPTGDLYVKAGDTCSSTNRGDAVQMTAGIHWPSVEYPLEWRGGGDSAQLTVFGVNLVSDSVRICAGGDEIHVCKANIHITTTPPIRDLPIDFSLMSRVTDSLSNQYYEGLSNFPGSVWPNHVTTDVAGTETVIYTSGFDASGESDQKLLLDIGVRAFYGGTACETVLLHVEPPQSTLLVFLDPTSGQQLESLVAGRTALNRLTVGYGNFPIPNHAVNWTFRFWDLLSLYEGAWEVFGLFFDELESDQRDVVFEYCGPDYEGTGPSDCGEILPVSYTDALGIAESTYTAGEADGYVEIAAEYANINLAER